MSTLKIKFHDKIKKILQIFSNIKRILQGLKNEFELAMINEPSVLEQFW